MVEAINPSVVLGQFGDFHTRFANGEASWNVPLYEFHVWRDGKIVSILKSVLIDAVNDMPEQTEVLMQEIDAALFMGNDYKESVSAGVVDILDVCSFLNAQIMLLEPVDAMPLRSPLISSGIEDTPLLFARNMLVSVMSVHEELRYAPSEQLIGIQAAVEDWYQHYIADGQGMMDASTYHATMWVPHVDWLQTENMGWVVQATLSPRGIENPIVYRGREVLENAAGE